jgi:pyruvate dehydrogenase E1 component alpha subunit
VPLGTGLAFRQSYRGNDNSRSRISATAPPIKGRFTRASTWRSSGSLPVIYVIENNRYAMGTSITRFLRRSNLSSAWTVVQHSRRPGRRHGRARREAAGAKAAHGADRKGPYILEMLTYRYRGIRCRTRPNTARGRGRRDPHSSTIRSTWHATICEEMRQRGRAQENRRRSA